MALTAEQQALDFNPELQDASRQRKLADLLMAQGLQQPQGQMISGYYIPPSFAQQLNPMANILASQAMGERADTKQLQLAKQLRANEGAAMADFMKLKQGQPGTPDQVTEMAGPYGQNVNKSGLDVSMPTATIAGRPAIAGNPQAAYSNLYADPRSTAKQRDFAFNKMNEGPMKVGINDVLLDPNTLKPVYEGAGDQPESIKYAVAIGQLPPNPKTWTPQQSALAQRIVESKSSAGASKFDFSNMLGKSATGEIGPMLVASKSAASSAVQQADAANRILNAVNTDKLFTGTGANQKLQLAQVGQMLGVTGDTAEQKINNTRSAMQGLAQLTLQGRQQMRGQGAITESEGLLAQRAISGDINFTPGEIRQLAEAAKRAGKFQYEQHQNMVNALAKDQPNAVPYYQLDANPNIFGPVGGNSANRARADAIIGEKN